GTVSDGRGAFVIHNLRAGTYQVRVSLLGYQTLVFREVVVLPDLRSRLAMRLKSMPIEMQGVEVTAERPLIQTDVTGTVWEKSAAQLETLPIEKFHNVI